MTPEIKEYQLNEEGEIHSVVNDFNIKWTGNKFYLEGKNSTTDLTIFRDLRKKIRKASETSRSIKLHISIEKPYSSLMIPIFELLDSLKEHHASGIAISVIWYYDPLNTFSWNIGTMLKDLYPYELMVK